MFSDPISLSLRGIAWLAHFQFRLYQPTHSLIADYWLEAK
jgi:hypothetical protein